jgi:DNA-directed RNA polymerase specialized sigma24 family protein
MNTPSVETNSVEALISQAADEYLQRLARGEQPQVEEYARRYPQIALTLCQVLPALKMLRQLAQQLLTGDSTASQRLDQEGVAQGVRRAVSQLPEMDREVLLMRTLEEHSFEEVSGTLKINPAAARKCYGRALLWLGMALCAPA